MLDFYIVVRGGVPFGPIQETPADKMAVKPEKYLKKMGSAANLVCLEIGAGAGDVDNPIRAVADFVGAKAGGFRGIGAVSIVGMSNGAALALGLAVELNGNRSAPQLRYVGATNIPLFAQGRKPPVLHIGAMKPLSRPTTSTGLKGRAKGAIFLRPSSVDLTFDQSVPPRVKLDRSFMSRKKVCFFETEGNHVTWVRLTSHWDWWSDMAGGEVHGEIEGFDENRRVPATGDSDFDKHNSVCQGAAFTEMMQQAADALADF